MKVTVIERLCSSFRAEGIVSLTQIKGAYKPLVFNHIARICA
jgi:hypothetical protein